jgi:hypothetical protein
MSEPTAASAASLSYGGAMNSVFLTNTQTRERRQTTSFHKPTPSVVAHLALGVFRQYRRVAAYPHPNIKSALRWQRGTSHFRDVPRAVCFEQWFHDIDESRGLGGAVDQWQFSCAADHGVAAASHHWRDFQR